MKVKFSRILATAGAVALVAAGGAAQARDVFWSVGVNAAPGVAIGVGNAPVVVAPQPVYAQPVYVAPQPVYVAPRPVVLAPAPVYYAPPPPVAIYYGPGYGYRHRGHGHGHHRHH